jgi:molybdopterin molybdotransferase
MISFEQAQRTILAACRRLPMEVVESTQALGRVLGEDVISPENLPPFDNSAMDGFALGCGGTTLAVGREFEVTGAIAAGDAPQTQGAGAVEIMTGAPMPAGFDGILPVEMAEVLERDADARPTRIRTLAEVVPGVHIRRRGQDVALGQAVLPSGTRIDASSRMLLAALGIADVRVSARPRVAILCTGRELLDDPRQALSPGQIRNSNGPFLADRLAGLGADICLRETLPDEKSSFLAAIARANALHADIVISTGAVSMGRYDFVPDALRELGAEIVFHKVAIRPGKPLLFARLPSGALFFGLPGNPVSSAVGLRFFVQPALRAMQGLPVEMPLRLPLAQPVEKKTGLRFLQKARVSVAGTGGLQVHLLPGQESFRIQPLLAANAWAVLPEAVENFSAGDLVEVFGLEDAAVSVAASGTAP